MGTGNTTTEVVHNQAIGTPYSVPLDYVGIAVTFFALGVFMAYKLMRAPIQQPHNPPHYYEPR